MHNGNPPAFLKAARKACRRCSKPSMAPQRNLLRLLRRSSSVRRINGAVFFQSLCHYPGWFMNITNKDKSSQIIYKWAMFIHFSISMDWWKRGKSSPETIDFSSKYGVILVGLSGWWLSPTPLKNMSSSVGSMKFPIYGKIEKVPNHQSVMNLMIVIIGYEINYINLTDYKLDYNDRGIGNSWL